MNQEERLRHIRNQWGRHELNMSMLHSFSGHQEFIWFPISTPEGQIFSFISGTNLLYMRDSDAEVTLLEAWDGIEELEPQRAEDIASLSSPKTYPYTFQRDIMRFFFRWPELMNFGQPGSLLVAHTIAPRNEEYMEDQPFTEWVFYCREERLWSQGLPILGEHDHDNSSRQLRCPHCQALLGLYPNFEALSPADAIRFARASGM